jgi:hypothetical protein
MSDHELVNASRGTHFKIALVAIAAASLMVLVGV